MDAVKEEIVRTVRDLRVCGLPDLASRLKGLTLVAEAYVNELEKEGKLVVARGYGGSPWAIRLGSQEEGASDSK